MELCEAKWHANELAWYRSAELPAVEPMRVRIMSTSAMVVRVSVQLDGAKSASPDQCFDADPSDLHFERSAFDDAPDTDRDP